MSASMLIAEHQLETVATYGSVRMLTQIHSQNESFIRKLSTAENECNEADKINLTYNRVAHCSQDEEVTS